MSDTRRIALDDDLDAVQDWFYEQGLTDGLPIVPPTPERVERMLAGTDFEPSDELGLMGPKWGVATIESLAINAVMAGCKPAYFPVVIAAIQAGALGYFPKTAPRSYLLEGIRRVADGVPYLPSGITQKLFNGLRKLQQPIAAGRLATDEPLTSRQEEILSLLGDGKSDAEIGKVLHLSEATVRSHIHHILQRLNLETRAQAMAYTNKRKKNND